MEFRGFPLNAPLLRHSGTPSVMKKTALFLFAGLIMTWADTAHALSFGNNIEVGMGQFLLLIVLHSIFLFVASKIADFEQPEFWRAVSCSLGIAAFLFFMLVLTGNNNDLQTIGLVIVAAAAIVLIQRIYNTTIGKTLIAFLITVVATTIAATLLSGAF